MHPAQKKKNITSTTKEKGQEQKKKKEGGSYCIEAEKDAQYDSFVGCPSHNFDCFDRI